MSDIQNNLIIEHFDIIDSTNDYLYRKTLTDIDINKNYLVIAKEQTNGHGRNNNTFLSKKNKGIYFSLLTYNENDILTLTANVSAIIYKQFKKKFNIELDIKWVNDLYYKNKKICGILVKKYFNFIIIGIGIDIYKNEELPLDLVDIVGYIFEEEVSNELIEKLIIGITLDTLQIINSNKILDEYFTKNIVYGKDVLISKNIYNNSKIILNKNNIDSNDLNEYECKIIDINDNGNLIVEDDNYIKIIDTSDVKIIMR